MVLPPTLKDSLVDPLPLENKVSFYLFEFLIHLLPSYRNHLLQFLKVITLHTISDSPFGIFSAACKETLCFQSLKKNPGISLAAQWLGPHTFTAGARPNPRLGNLRSRVPRNAAREKKIQKGKEKFLLLRLKVNSLTLTAQIERLERAN